MQGPDGELLGGQIVLEIRSFYWMCFKDLKDRGEATWLCTDMSETVLTRLCEESVKRFPTERLCVDGWKARELMRLADIDVSSLFSQSQGQSGSNSRSRLCYPYGMHNEPLNIDIGLTGVMFCRKVIWEASSSTSAGTVRPFSHRNDSYLLCFQFVCSPYNRSFALSVIALQITEQHIPWAKRHD